jgi:hypothetical protein
MREALAKRARPQRLNTLVIQSKSHQMQTLFTWEGPQQQRLQALEVSFSLQRWTTKLRG